MNGLVRASLVVTVLSLLAVTPLVHGQLLVKNSTNSNVMIVRQDGRVGVGMTDPAQIAGMFHVQQLGRGAGDYCLYAYDTKSYFGGPVGIGTTAPTAGLHAARVGINNTVRKLWTDADLAIQANILAQNGTQNTTRQWGITSLVNHGLHSGGPASHQAVVGFMFNGDPANSLSRVAVQGGLAVSTNSAGEEEIQGLFSKMNAPRASAIGAAYSTFVASGLKIEIDDNTTALSNVFAIHAYGAKSYFANAIGLGTTAPASMLHIYDPGRTNPAQPSLIVDASSGGASAGNATLLLQSDFGAAELTLGRSGLADPRRYSVVLRNKFSNTNAGILFETGSNVIRMYIRGDGNVGVGTTTPGYLFQVGNLGDGTQARSNGWNLLSDVNYKENVRTLHHSLDIVEQLRGVSFEWKKSGDKSIGFIAQEVEKVLPEVVSKGDDGVLSMNYDVISAVLVEALKEQQKEIKRLNEDVSKLRKLLE